MERAGIAELPLHYGKCPRWLFSRMVPLASSISEIIVEEYGTKEFLERLADPFWFQAFGNVLGFDWHSSGLTTTVCGALKEALNRSEIPLKVAGGKGKTSLKTPDEIENLGWMLDLDEEKLGSMVFASKMSAKVDNAAVQDSYTLYHHVFVFDDHGRWAVVQQGMNYSTHYARRYHWIWKKASHGFVDAPHAGICTQRKEDEVLDFTSRENKEVREACVDLVNEGAERVARWVAELGKNNLLRFVKVSEKDGIEGRDALSKYRKEKEAPEKKLVMPADHFRIELDKRSKEVLKKLEEAKPSDFQEIVAFQGVGPKTLRALALTSQLIYGTEISWKDPARFSFAHGGKDGVPYPVNKRRMEKTYDLLKDAIENARLGRKDKLMALRRLADWIEER